jgi:hypothetical protein
MLYQDREGGYKMKSVTMKKILKELNKKWGLDFVSETMGNCCRTCGDQRTPEETEQAYNAETFLIINWYFTGMNYHLPFAKTETFFVMYDLGHKTNIYTVCTDLQNALEGHFIVTAPLDSSKPIILTRV